MVARFFGRGGTDSQRSHHGEQCFLQVDPYSSVCRLSRKLFNDPAPPSRQVGIFNGNSGHLTLCMVTIESAPSFAVCKAPHRVSQCHQSMMSLGVTGCHAGAELVEAHVRARGRYRAGGKAPAKRLHSAADAMLNRDALCGTPLFELRPCLCCREEAACTRL